MLLVQLNEDQLVQTISAVVMNDSNLNTLVELSEVQFTGTALAVII
jgi:formyltetrahydrofolate hydrolase